MDITLGRIECNEIPHTLAMANAHAVMTCTITGDGILKFLDESDE